MTKFSSQMGGKITCPISVFYEAWNKILFPTPKKGRIGK